MDRQAAAGHSHGAQRRVGCVLFAGAILSAYRRRLWPTMVCAGPSLLLKLWFIDRMTFY